MGIEVRVLVFAGLRERLGWSEKPLELPVGATVGDALEALVPPELRPALAAAVNREYATRDTELTDGDELALLPPVSGGVDTCRVTERPLELEPLIAEVSHKSCGAVLTFQGTARELPGETLERLSYEAYPEMAEASFRAIMEEACKRFGVDRIAIVHRVGDVPTGEASVAIAVAAPHRGPAFDALRFVIDTLKETAPIWKKEVTRSGERWVEGSTARPVGSNSDGD